MSDEENNETTEAADAADEGHYVARCRGLPWSTTVDEIKNFFNNCQFKEGKAYSLFCQSRPRELYFSLINLKPLYRYIINSDVYSTFFVFKVIVFT